MARPVARAAAMYAGLSPSREPQNTHTESIELHLRALSGSMLPSAYTYDPKRVSCQLIKRGGAGIRFQPADLLRSTLCGGVHGSARGSYRVTRRLACQR